MSQSLIIPLSDEILTKLDNELIQSYQRIDGDFYQLTQIDEGDGLEIKLQEFGKPLAENEEVMFVFSAKSWEEAMTIKHKFLGFKPYKPMN